MPLLNLMRLLRATGDAPSAELATSMPQAGYESEEEHLSRELEALERDHPGWREDTRVDNAMLRLRRGMPATRVRSMFGDATYQEALTQLRAAGERGVPAPSEAYARAAALIAAGGSH